MRTCQRDTIGYLLLPFLLTAFVSAQVPTSTSQPQLKLITGSHPFPSDQDEWRKQEIDAGEAVLNGANRKLKDITITGRQILIDKNHNGNSVYEYLEERKDIRNLVIKGETIIVRSPLIVRHANVELFSRVLKFEPQGSISTTPSPNLQIPSSPDGVHPVVGSPGENAGDITLHVGEVQWDGLQSQALITDGSQGQRGGIGQDGISGERFTSWDGWEQDVYLVHAIGWDIEGINKVGTNHCPKAAEPPIADGKPGNGGNAGKIASSGLPICDPSSTAQDKCLPVSMRPGLRGSPGETRKGSDGPWPPNAIWLHALRGYRCSGGRENRSCSEIHTVQDKETIFCAKSVRQEGYDAAPPPVGDSDGLPGQIVTTHPTDPLEQKGITPEAVSAVIEYSKQLYLHEYFADAQRVLSEYSSLLSPIVLQSAGGSSAYTESTGMYTSEALEIESLLHRLTAQLDFFGNPGGYVPQLSFAFHKSAYESELDFSIRTLYAIYWLKDKDNELKDKKVALTVLRTKTEDDINASVRRYNELQSTIQQLRRDLHIANQDADTIKVRLDDATAELQKLAESRVADRQRKAGFLGTLAALTKIVPVFQPALGTIGSGMSLLANINPNDPIGSIGSVPSILDKLNSADLDGSFQILQTQIATFDPSKYKNPKDYIDAVRPQLNKVTELQSALAATAMRTSAPASEVEAEFDKLKAADQEYQELRNSVQRLSERLAELARESATVVQDVSNLSDRIASETLTVDALSKELNKASEALSPVLDAYLDDIGKAAHERLILYHYYVAKSYEYRELRPYSGDVDADTQFSKLLRLASQDSNFTAADTGKHSPILTKDEFEMLKVVYAEPIQAQIQEIVKKATNAAEYKEGEVTYSIKNDDYEILNRTGRLVLSLNSKLLPSESDQRIISLTSSFSSTSSDGVKLTFLHPLTSIVQKGDDLFLFRHAAPMYWATRFEPGGTLTQDAVDEDKTSLLWELLGRQPQDYSSISIVAAPSLRGEITICKETEPFAEVIKSTTSDDMASGCVDRGVTPARIENLQIKIKYTYTLR
jgi:hypothetical protein